MSEKLHHWTLLQRNKNIFPQKNCAEVSTVALSIIAENWRQPRYSSMADWFDFMGTFSNGESLKMLGSMICILHILTQILQKPTS